ncbi:flagellar protein, partial [Helicobacter pylori]|nr:flagellar protein [Helicobacter pylori]
LSSQLVAHKDEKGAKKPKLSSQLVAHKDEKGAKKPKNSVV